MSQEDMHTLREEIRNTAEFYTERLVDYIRHNTSSYPEYNTNTGSDVSPTKNVYYSGMNLERATMKDRGGMITLDDFLTPDLNP